MAAAVETAAEAQKPARRPLPQHLPREDRRHPAPCTCPSCGGALRKIGDEVTGAPPEEIAAAALFLASDEASFVAGVDFPVDGGMTAV